MFLRYLLVLIASSAATHTFSQINTTRTPSTSVGDARVVSGVYANDNFQYNGLSIGHHTTNNTVSRSFLHFHLSTIPTNAIVTSSHLTLRYSSSEWSSNETLRFELVEDSWDSGSITWNNQPSVSTSSAIDITPTGTLDILSQHVFAGLEPMSQLWINEPTSNKGLRIRAISESTNNEVNYTGTFPSFNIFPPVLHLSYVFPIEINLESITHCSTTSSTDGSISVSASEGGGGYSYQWHDASGAPIGTDSPTISGLEYGWYGVQVATAYDTSYMSFIVGVECENVAISYNPPAHYFENAVAAYLSTGSSSSQFWVGNYESLMAFRANISGINYNYKSLFRFLIQLDNNLTINKAQLELKGYGEHGDPYSESNAVRLKLVEGNWHIIDSYANYPNVNATMYAEIPATLAADDDASVNVKSFFDSWKNTPNYGWSMEMANSGALIAQAYRSLHYGDSDYWPYIEFEVSISCRYPELFSVLHSGYYTMKSTELFIAYDESYLTSEGELNYTVYNEQRVKQTGLPAANIVYGDNRIHVDMASLANGIYILEVTNQKNRKYYFRFKKDSL